MDVEDVAKPMHGHDLRHVFGKSLAQPCNQHVGSSAARAPLPPAGNQREVVTIEDLRRLLQKRFKHSRFCRWEEALPSVDQQPPYAGSERKAPELQHLVLATFAFLFRALEQRADPA